MNRVGIVAGGLIITADWVCRTDGSTGNFTEDEQRIIERTQSVFEDYGFVNIPRVGDKVEVEVTYRLPGKRPKSGTVTTWVKNVESPSCILVGGSESLVRLRMTMSGEWYVDPSAGRFDPMYTVGAIKLV